MSWCASGSAARKPTHLPNLHRHSSTRNVLRFQAQRKGYELRCAVSMTSHALVSAMSTEAKRRNSRVWGLFPNASDDLSLSHRSLDNDVCINLLTKFSTKNVVGAPREAPHATNTPAEPPPTFKHAKRAPVPGRSAKDTSYVVRCP